MTPADVREFKRRVVWRSVRTGSLVALVFGLVSRVLLDNHVGELKFDFVGALLIPFMLSLELSGRTVGPSASPLLFALALAYLMAAGALIGAVGGYIRNSRRGL